MKIYFTLLVIVSMICHVSGTVLRVPLSYSSIQSALNACSVGDTVQVSPGTYHENIVWPQVVSISLISTDGSDSTIIDANNNGQVIRCSWNTLVDTEMVIKGFSIRNGYFITQPQNGGGLMFYNSGGLLEDLLIDSNKVAGEWPDGGGIYFSGSHFLLKNIRIKNNSNDANSVSSGGGVYIESSSVRFDNCEISNNVESTGAWSYGGGLYIDGSTVTFNNCKISGNILQVGNYAQGTGGGLYTFSSQIIMDSTSVENNIVNSDPWAYGAGIYHLGGSLEINYSSVHDNVLNCTNEAYGSGIYFESGDLNINFSSVSENQTNAGYYGYGAGCGIYSKDCNLTADGLRIENIHLYAGSSGSAYGSGLFCLNTISEFTNLLLANNVLNSSGSIGAAGAYFGEDGGVSTTVMNHCTVANHNSGTPSGNSIVVGIGPLTIRNSIIWSNTGTQEIAINAPASLIVEYSDISSGGIGIGDISSDPLFVGSNDFHLMAGSPCMGTGNSNVQHDLENISRPLPVGNAPDMGAFEGDENLLSVFLDPNVDFIKILVYPNPFMNDLHLSHQIHEDKRATPLNIEIYNSIGTLFLKQTVGQFDELILHLEELLNGYYILKCSDDRSRFVAPIVKQNFGSK